MNKKKIMASVIMSVFAVSAVFSGMMFYWQTNDQKKSAEDFDTLAQLIVEETPVIDELPVNEEEEPQTEAVLTAYEKYVELYNLNNDFVGWISIADTAINYPVMQTVNNPDYYLKKNFVKKYSDYGVPYVDSDCSIDLSTNTVIYGHNMKNGSMFSSLVSYANKSYFEEHPIICFDTLGGYGEYQVIAAFRFDTNNETFFYNDCIDMNEDELNEFIENCMSRRLYDTGVTAEYGDKLLTLSTCEYTYTNGRFVVVAKLISE